MALPNTEVAAERSLDLKTRLSGANLTAVEVATLLRVHPMTVYRLAKHGELPGFKTGGDWWFDPAQIEGWIRARTQGPEG